MFWGHGNILTAGLQEPDNANNCPIPWPDRKESAVGETSEQGLGEVWLLLRNTSLGSLTTDNMYTEVLQVIHAGLLRSMKNSQNFNSSFISQLIMHLGLSFMGSLTRMERRSHRPEWQFLPPLFIHQAWPPSKCHPRFLCCWWHLVKACPHCNEMSFNSIPLREEQDLN